MPPTTSLKRRMMESTGRRFSTVTQLNPENLERMGRANGALDTIGEDMPPDYRGNRKFTATFGHLALYKREEDGDGPPASFISGYTTPGPKERATSEHKKANLGVLLGVYLPTIQHILGVTMFIRLFWVVGMAGLLHTLLLLFICCMCTLLTSISLSAVATNGVVESGGAYFIISRNLGAEFGSAVGILFYLANTVAASMYLVGGVEVVLMYIWPEMAIGGEEALHDHDTFGMLFNNFRIYGTIFLIVEVLIVAMGVKFVQLMAPISLMCVILAILACFAGGVEKAITQNGQMVCSLDDRLLHSRILFNHHNISHHNNTNLSPPTICDVCEKSPDLASIFCASEFCAEYTKITMRCSKGFPGFNKATLQENMYPTYMEKGEALPTIQGKADAEQWIYTDESSTISTATTLNPQYLYCSENITLENCNRIAQKKTKERKKNVDEGKFEDPQIAVVQDATTTFFVLLAIYFPAVTGIMTGTNMSGDLKDPQRSIPTGTIAATVSTSIIYVALAVLFAGSIDRSVLRDKFGRSIEGNMVVATLAWPSPWIVTVGSFLSTFGAALQCLCSAPRLLQSIAKDDVIPILSPFARVTKKNEPLLGLLLTTIIAEAAILLGAVDKIAEVLDFFFLMCYAFVNLIAFLHSVLKAPNWRPRFKYFHWSISLLGAFLCFFIMFASDWKLALISCGITFAIYKYVEWKGAKKEWGDGIRGLALTTAQYSLQKVEDKDPHPKNWRPQLLICLSTQWSKELIDKRAASMLSLGAQLKAGRGLAIACAFLKGAADDVKDKAHARDVKQRLLKDMAAARLRGFGKTMFYTNDQIYGCVSALYQSVGIGGLRPNTILLNWPNIEHLDEVYLFAEELIHGIMNENCVLVAKGITDFPDHNDRLTGFIDIWWVVQDGGILMLIAYLLKQHKVWRGCSLRIFAIGENDETKSEEMRKGLQKYIYMLRIDADVFMVNLLDEEVSEEVVERTLEIERRQKLMQEMRRSRSRESGYINDAYNNDDTLSGRSTRLRPTESSKSLSSPTVININEEEETSFINNARNAVDGLYGGNTPSDESEKEGGDIKLNLHKMNTSVRLNRVIRENSPDSQLVLLNLPHPTKSRSSFIHSYMLYLDVLTEDLKRVLFIGGSGKEVITINS